MIIYKNLITNSIYIFVFKNDSLQIADMTNIFIYNIMLDKRLSISSLSFT